MTAKRVLVVEDEMMVAMLVEDLVAELGHQVVASAAHLDEAVQLARTAEFDLAILDMNLGGERTFPVADVLNERRIPFLFASGYGAGGLPPEHRDAVIVQKPFAIGDLAEAMDRLPTARAA